MSSSLIGGPRQRVSSVLDASALLALLLDEPGSARVAEVMSDDAFISAVNVTEVVTRQIDLGLAGERAQTVVAGLRLTIVPFDEDLAYRAALLRVATRSAGLSLGDRACLALAERLGLPTLTADRAWAALQIGAQIEVIR